MKLVLPIEGATASADVVYLAVLYKGPSVFCQTSERIQRWHNLRF